MTLMTLAKILAVTAIVCAVISPLYWWLNAKRLAAKHRKAFGPRPQSPRGADMAYWQQQIIDRELEAEWRARVRENVARRKRAADASAAPVVSFLLRRQAD